MPPRISKRSAVKRASVRIQTRPRFKTLREFELSPADEDRFCAELRKEFPTIRFMLDDYLEHWIEREFGDAEVDPSSGRSYTVMVSKRMRPPHGDPMPYTESFRALPRDRLMGWVEPPGWKPNWSAKPCYRGNYVLLNRPKLDFVYCPASYSITGSQGISKPLDQPPLSLGESEICCLHGGFIYGRCLLGDLDQMEFLNKVWRIARRVSTNRLARVDRVTLQTLPIPVPRSIRVGHDVAEWTMRDRRHLVGVDADYLFRADVGIRNRK